MDTTQVVQLFPTAVVTSGIVVEPNGGVVSLTAALERLSGELATQDLHAMTEKVEFYKRELADAERDLVSKRRALGSGVVNALPVSGATAAGDESDSSSGAAE